MEVLNKGIRCDWCYFDAAINSEEENVSHGVFIDNTLYHSECISVYDTKAYGKMVVLDGAIQVTESDEHFYHEALVHLPMKSHGNPQRVCIIGGGDGCSLREVLKYSSVKTVDFCEISREMIDACSEHFPQSNLRENLKDQRVNLFVEDGATFIKNKTKEYDVIIIDGPDPYGEARSIFSYEFMEDCRKALEDENGQICFQCLSFINSEKFIREMLFITRLLYVQSDYFYVPMPTYFCGNIGFIFGSNKHIFLDRQLPLEVDTKFYKGGAQELAFCKFKNQEEKVEKVLGYFDSKFFNHLELEYIMSFGRVERERQPFEGRSGMVFNLSVDTSANEICNKTLTANFYYKNYLYTEELKRLIIDKRNSHIPIQFINDHILGFSWTTNGMFAINLLLRSGVVVELWFNKNILSERKEVSTSALHSKVQCENGAQYYINYEKDFDRYNLNSASKNFLNSFPYRMTGISYKNQIHQKLYFEL